MLHTVVASIGCKAVELVLILRSYLLWWRHVDSDAKCRHQFVVDIVGSGRSFSLPKTLCLVTAVCREVSYLWLCKMTANFVTE